MWSASSSYSSRMPGCWFAIGLLSEADDGVPPAPAAREAGAVRWLLISVGLSVAFTVLLNVGLGAFPDAGDRLARNLTKLTSANVDHTQRNHRRIQVFAPWKAMLLGSLILTIVINLTLWIT